MEEYKLQTAELLVRLFAGVLFLFQGYDKLFKIKPSGVIDSFMADASERHIPKSAVSLITYYTSLTEFIGGLLLIFGLLTNYVLFALGLDLFLVVIAFSFLEPMWDMKHVFPRLVLVVALLLMPEHYHFFSLDHFINK